MVVLGAGKVGSAVAVLLRDAGVSIEAVTTQSVATAQEASARIGCTAGTDNAAAARKGDIILVTTNDDAIARVVADVAREGGFRDGQLVVHMSGALRLVTLGPAAEAGAAIGAAHPMQAFATAQDALRMMRGSTFGITPGPGSGEQIEALVEVLGGTAIMVADENKALYHAAAVMASNYLVAVEASAVHLLVSAGFDEPSALRALQPLVAGTVDNVRRMGTGDALTGPIVRGDVDTVRQHIKALRGLPGNELQLYRVLGRRTLEIARRRETLPPDKVEALVEALADD